MTETLLSKRRKELKEKLRGKALRRIDEAAALLYNEGAEEVYIFGTVLRSLEFNEHSDADIAVRGISEDKRATVAGKLEYILKEIPLDIVFLEDNIRPEIRRRIKQDGILWKH